MPVFARIFRLIVPRACVLVANTYTPKHEDDQIKCGIMHASASAQTININKLKIYTEYYNTNCMWAFG